jgi:molybdopterin converting factor small subunit
MNRKKYFYVYYSYEPWGRGYIGKRECFCLPEEDVKYFGSFYDKTFKPTEKIILQTFDTLDEVYEAEIILHNFYNVKDNLHFVNKSNQNAKFCTKELKISNVEFKNKFVDYVKTSKSVREIIRKLGLKIAGGTHTKIKEWINLLNLDTSHFKKIPANKGKKCPKTKQQIESNCKYIYNIISPDGETIEINNLKDFCRKNNLCDAHMYKVCTGKATHHKGYKVKRVDNKQNLS